MNSSLGLGHGMAMPLHSLEPGSVGAWLAVPQTQRRSDEYLACLHRIVLALHFDPNAPYPSP